MRRAPPCPYVEHSVLPYSCCVALLKLFEKEDTLKVAAAHGAAVAALFADSVEVFPDEAKNKRVAAAKAAMRRRRSEYDERDYSADRRRPRGDRSGRTRPSPYHQTPHYAQPQQWQPAPPAFHPQGYYAPPPPPAMPPRGKTCFKCQRSGHSAFECPMNGGPRLQRPM